MTRVMWLLNHTTARKFEIPMLKKIGITEIFLPKKIPVAINFRSADIDYSEDKNLTIPAEELAILNQVNWYEDVPDAAWKIANKYFDVVFFIAHSLSIFKNIKKFNGALIWRTYGLSKDYSYTKIISNSYHGISNLQKLGQRFWFGQAYDHLHEIESPYIQKRKLFLPLGLNSCEMINEWEGKDKRLFFICPDHKFNSYYQEVYTNFCKNFGDFPFACGGAQPIKVHDPRVLGFVSSEENTRNFRQFRVMFYHSTEPNHIHFHPLEAIRAGMPLVFMGGGMLDKMGGKDLPGRCKSITEARDKIQRILNDDWDLIKSIRESQTCLLNSMRPENCEQAWRNSFAQLRQTLEEQRALKLITKPRKKRIAIIMPINYRGGTLKGAKILAKTLWEGSRHCGEDADIILVCPDEPSSYAEEFFADLPEYLSKRTYHWKILKKDAARRAMIYAGHSDWQSHLDYITPDDGIQQLTDCDMWIIISDRVSQPILPIRPYVLMVYDFLQRYVVELAGHDQAFLNTARFAQHIMVTTEFTKQDALQYAGLPPQNVHKMPMLIPDLQRPPHLNVLQAKPYFLWTTNTAPHKNHINALKALQIYYEELGGTLECHVTGVNTQHILKNNMPHLKPLAEITSMSSMLKSNLHFAGELSSAEYLKKLANAVFLWHPCQIDNGTFSVIEAAQMQVPSLSSDYPAMREIEEQFNLNIMWMPADQPEQIARKLLWMETNAHEQRNKLPSTIVQNHKQVASQYWEVIQSCL